MNSSETLSPIERVLQMVEETAIKLARHPLDNSIEVNNLQLIAGFILNTRWQQVRDSRTAARVLVSLVDSEWSMDYLIDVSQSITLKLHGMGLYSDTLTWVRSAMVSLSHAKSALPTEYVSKMPEATTYGELLEANPWLMVSILIFQTHAMQKLQASVEKNRPAGSVPVVVARASA